VGKQDTHGGKMKITKNHLRELVKECTLNEAWGTSTASINDKKPSADNPQRMFDGRYYQSKDGNVKGLTLMFYDGYNAYFLLPKGSGEQQKDYEGLFSNEDYQALATMAIKLIPVVGDVVDSAELIHGLLTAYSYYHITPDKKKEANKILSDMAIDFGFKFVPGGELVKAIAGNMGPATRPLIEGLLKIIYKSLKKETKKLVKSLDEINDNDARYY
jgi:hypothetical protein